MPNPYMNLVILQGRVLETPHLFYSGPMRLDPTVHFKLVMSRKYTVENGKRLREDTVIRCECFAGLGHEFVELVGRNSWVTVEGQLRSYRYMDGREEHVVIVNRFNVLTVEKLERGAYKKAELMKAHSDDLGLYLPSLGTPPPPRE